MESVCLWIAELVPLIATLFSPVYGLKRLSYMQTLAGEEIVEGFTPAYLGRNGATITRYRLLSLRYLKMRFACSQRR